MAAKLSKLTKIKSVLKRMHSFNLRRPTIAASVDADDDDRSPSSKDLHAVYVGKSRRRYLITSNVMENPLIRELIDRHGGVEEESPSSSITVGCEVVLFEHLLWMLENADPAADSLDELVDFYAC